ncbi:MAG: homoserine dehydrogenase [Rhodoferax sp.]|nr:homoserine dehydrogenase [Rhodoferax sp.]
MSQQRIAIIGLGRIGSAFLMQMLKKRNLGLEIVCVAESGNTPGRAMALETGLRVCSLDDVVALGHDVDVIFELTGLAQVRRELRDKLVASQNKQTVIASESIVRVIWALISDDALPEIAGRATGY